MKNLKRIALVLVAMMFVMTAFTACDMPQLFDIETYGTWVDAYDGKRVITNETLSVYSASADTEPAYVFSIVSYNNGGWNGGETGEGNDGHAICKCTAAPSWNESQLDTYTVFRWENITTADGTTTYEFAEGSPTTWPDGYETSVSGAYTNATDANGWFYYSSGTLQE